jgi:antitoxin VapB
MALSIKNRQTEALARELARITKKPITKAIHDALEREVRREKDIDQIVPKTDLAATLLQIGKRAAALTIINTMKDDEILGYDEFGAPTR